MEMFLTFTPKRFPIWHQMKRISYENTIPSTLLSLACEKISILYLYEDGKVSTGTQ